LLSQLDPFLLLDEFKSDSADDYVGGFPDHPHRGFETVTYMLAGRMRHRDNHGHEGLLTPGSVQWMTAGRGIIHSEMPEQESGLMHGFQLWVNPPARDKLTAPRYEEFEAGKIAVATPADGVKVRVIAGHAFGADGPVAGIVTDPLYLDVQLGPNREFAIDVPGDHNAVVYVFEGGAQIGPVGKQTVLPPQTLAALGSGERVAVRTANRPARFLLIAGRPLNEPVARYGPFVMNTQRQIREAIADFQGGRF